MNHQLRDQLERYSQAEQDRIRSVLTQELDVLISMLLQTDTKEYRSWVYELSGQVVDEDSGFPIRMPLFEQVIFPVVFAGFKQKAPNTARWLAGYNQLIYKSKKVRAELGADFTEDYFLRKAIEHDPEDTLSKKKLISAIAYQLEYSIHEVPSGVLWGSNGASLEECDELILSLVEFKNILLSFPHNEEYKQLVEECSFHFAEYKKYIINYDSHESYSAYLSSIGRNA